jgi:fido (protein-threonine AMPylation protein)
MVKSFEKLAQSLEVLRKLQKGKPTAVFRPTDISRTHRERLLKNGFIEEVMKGWYISVNPNDTPGDTTPWYTSFWNFCSEYLDERFSDVWIVSPEQATSLHSGNWTVPHQLIVRTPKGHNNKTELPFGTSLFDLEYKHPDNSQLEVKNGIRLFALPYALINCSSNFFTANPTDARVALAKGGHSTIAGRLAGAFRNIGSTTIADEIIKTFKSAGYDVRENDPFDNKLPSIFSIHEPSPYVDRIQLMWHHMRDRALEIFPHSPGIQVDVKTYMDQVEDIYKTDAYHSLSIEGYRVTTELIERVQSGAWDPENHPKDREKTNAMAARGYWQAFQSVKKSLVKVLNMGNPGDVVSNDHREWYREMFTPSVTAGLLRQTDLAGYRNGPVFIRNSKHVPLNPGAVRDAMPKFFKLLINEPEPAVRVVLGHFIFEYIHPYMDGNGRIGRFLMNVMLASGGFPWTVIRVDDRKEYMEALEEASINENIVPFTKFIAGLVSQGL